MEYSFLELLNGLADPMVLGMMLLGCVVGIVIGAIPGLSGSIGIILLLPLIYTLDMVPAMVVMAGIICGCLYGGSISAILISAPGTPSAAATCLDGYPMAQEGKAGKAIRVALIASVCGGILSGLCLMFLSPILAKFALKFQAPEYFALAIFGLSLIASTGKNIIKGLISGFIGLFFSTIGINVITGTSRFTFGTVFLSAGIKTLPLLVGLFAMSTVLGNVCKGEYGVKQEDAGGAIRLSKEEWKMLGRPILIGAVLGIVIGIMPGAGGAIACFVAYETARRFAKKPELFGKGSVEGLAAAESSNNGTSGGAIIPLLTLGVPGDVMTSVMLGVFMLIGIKPGPTLFQEFGLEVNTFFLAFMVMQFVILALGLLGTKLWIKILKIPNSILMPLVLMFCFLGAYASSGSTRDGIFVLIFGVIGYFMNKYGYPTAPVILGLILGPMAEQNLERTLIIFKSWTAIFTRPISCVLMVIAIGTILWTLSEPLRTMIKEKKEKKADA